MIERDETVVTEPAWIWPVFPLLGAGAGWLLTLLPGWLAFFLPIPPVEVVARFLPDPWATAGAIGLGAAAGLTLAAYTWYGRLIIAVSHTQATLTHWGTVTELGRDRTAAVFRDGKELVLLDRDGAELARQPCDLSWSEIAEAFSAHGWPWRPDGDPYRDQFRRWVPDLPELPATAHALFQAREKALAGEDQEDAAELRTELARLGIVVREEQTRQFWRRYPCDETLD